MATPRLSTDNLCLLTNNLFYPNIFSDSEDHNGLRQARPRARSFSAGGGAPTGRGSIPHQQKMGEFS